MFREYAKLNTVDNILCSFLKIYFELLHSTPCNKRKHEEVKIQIRKVAQIII